MNQPVWLAHVVVGSHHWGLEERLGIVVEEFRQSLRYLGAGTGIPGLVALVLLLCINPFLFFTG